jgi:ATP-dependent Lon protease
MELRDSTRSYPSELPVLPLQQTVVFPLALQPFIVNHPVSVESVNRALAGDRLLFLTLQDTEGYDPQPDDLRRVGTIGSIRQMAKSPNGALHVVVEGTLRARSTAVTRSDLSLKATVEPWAERSEPSLESDAYVRRIRELIDRAQTLAPEAPELRSLVATIDEPLRLAYVLASLLPIKAADKQQILEAEETLPKLKSVADAVNHEVTLLEIKGKIESAAQQEMTDAQRQYYLRQQLKAIQDELGEGERPEAQELRKRLADAKLPETVAAIANREVDRLERMTPASPEYQMIRTYLDWVLDVPWSVVTTDRLDPGAAREVLDQDHYDLDKVKERIVEYLAVQKLKTQQSTVPAVTARAAVPAADTVAGTPAVPAAATGTPVPSVTGITAVTAATAIRGPILCFVGPPGVGKTSLGQSIARAMNRKFVRISLGGVRDEAEIRGHRRTYIGALPGRIVQALKQAGAMNPVFMLDEIDKIGVGNQGDPASALLEVLDPAQNHSFRDHYLEINIDLSRVLFIATANQLGTIHPALLDRMELISLAGYSEEEKLHIAHRYLIPRQLEEHGLRPGQLTLPDETLRRIVSDYTREAGVRSLERQIGAVARKIAARVAGAETNAAASQVVVHAGDLPDYLGPPRFHDDVAFRLSRPGVATGVAWTEAGGDVLFVEASLLPSGSQGIILTGQLGSVMQESARTAVSHIRASAVELGVPAGFLDHHDLHVHVPAGAIPKDGPSAGVTIATAIVSAIRQQPVREGVAMTGEITLSGVVLPVGGIREKVLAARRHGIKEFILPARNVSDLAELPPEVKSSMTFVPVTTLADVLKLALPDAVPAVP